MSRAGLASGESLAGPWWRRCAALWVVAFVAVSPASAGAQTWNAPGTEPPLPPGLAVVWRVDGRKLDAHASAWSLAAFSTDGALVGVSDDSGTRIYGADDGRLVRVFPAPFSTGQFAFALAISSNGLVATGRVGGLEIHSLERGGEPLRFHCRGVCGPVSALAFSPNDRWLAYQAASGSLESTPGLVNVVDLTARASIAELEASATRTGVAFSADSRTLVAGNVVRIDDTGTFGVRAWSGSADWRRTRDVAGAAAPPGSIGPFAFDERAAVYAREGRMELRELASGTLVWTASLVPPSIDAPTSGSTKLDLAVVSRRLGLVLSYESPLDRGNPGAIVLRRLGDGGIVGMYDVPHVSALAVAPAGDRFMYSTGAGRTYTVVARVPL